MRCLPLLLGLVLCAPLPALAGDLRAPVLAALDGVEDPPTQDALTALGEGVAAELLEIAKDDSLPRSRRGRAVSALGWFPSDDIRSDLTTWLASDDRLLARKAAGALATGWGDAAVVDLSTALASDDVQLRVATSKALGSIGSDTARQALQARLDAETNATVQDSIRAALGQ